MYIIYSNVYSSLCIQVESMPMISHTEQSKADLFDEFDDSFFDPSVQKREA
jgi:hypothetical protein